MKSVTSRLSAACALALIMSSGAFAQDFQAEFDSQWGLKMIGVDKALAKGLDGRGVTVGVADSGLQIGDDLHPELVGRYVDGVDGFGLGLTDLDGHGTHVAGIIAASRDGRGMLGVASGANILAMRVLRDGITLEQQQMAMATAYEYAWNQGVRLFNASYGYDGPFTSIPPEGIANYPAIELEIYRQVVAGGGLMVVAAGNDAYSVPSVPGALPSLFPELTPGWMVVTAVGPTGERAGYAQACGGGTKWYCIAAPGGDFSFGPDGAIKSTFLDWGYAGFQGTSMATPHVTGAVAIAKQLYPNASYQDLAQLVFQTATDIGEAGVDDIYGWGLLNVGNVVDTYSAEAGALYAQSIWSHATTLDRIADAIDARPVQANPDRSGFWLTPFGSYADLSLGNSQLSGRYTTGGMMGGFDYAINDQWTFGTAIGFARNQFKADSGNTTQDVSYHVAPYIAFESDAFFADATIGASYFSNDTHRVSAPGMSGTVLGNSGLNLSSNQDDKALWAALRAGTHFDVSGVKASPYVFGRVARQYLGTVNETGASILALQSNSTTATTGELGVGMKVSGTGATFQELVVTPSLDLAYGRQMGDYSRTLELLGNRVDSEIDPNRNQFQVGADVLLTKPGTSFETKLSYRAELSSDVISHTVSANLGFKF